jgi:hypothetical protein
MVFCEFFDHFHGGHVMDLDRRNPGGIRFGSSELYDVVGSCFSGNFAEQTIVDCLAVGQKIDGGADERVILFVKLSEGQSLSLGLEQKIKTEIRTRRSPRHVPARVRVHCPITGNLFYIGHAVDHPGYRYPIHVKW